MRVAAPSTSRIAEAVVGEPVGPQAEQPGRAGKAVGIGQRQALEVAIAEIARHDHHQRRGVVGQGRELLRLAAEGRLEAAAEGAHGLGRQGGEPAGAQRRLLQHPGIVLPAHGTEEADLGRVDIVESEQGCDRAQAITAIGDQDRVERRPAQRIQELEPPQLAPRGIVIERPTRLRSASSAAWRRSKSATWRTTADGSAKSGG